MNQSVGAHSRRRESWAHRRRNYGPPSSPLLRWKLDDDDNRATGGGVEVSARKLAAGLWQLRFREISWGKDLNCGSYEPGVETRDYGAETKTQLQSPQCVLNPKNSILHELESSLPYPKCASERATKWDPGCSKQSDDIHRIDSHMKLLKDCQVTTGSIVSTLNAELKQSKLCIRDLEAKQRSFKKKVKQFLRKLEEERIFWQSKECQKNRVVIEDLKKELSRERKSRKQMENLNTNLINQLANARLSAEQFMKNYEEEKKSRKLMEEICNELAQQIGEDKDDVKELKRESMKILEEVEEERKMLQMAEVWREERVKMKLIDAKLALEDKYCQMNKLITDIENFLKLSFGTLDMMELRKAESILQAVKFLNIQDIEDFSYVPPQSDDIFSVFEELRQCEGNKREIEPCNCYSPSSPDSRVHPVSPEDSGFNKNPSPSQLNCINDYNSGLQEDVRCWDNVSHAEDQGSRDSLEGRNPSINRVSQGKNVLRSRSECNDNVSLYSPDMEISEVCSVSEKQTKQKASSMSKLWRSCPGKGKFYKIVLDEGDRRLPNGSTSNWGTNSHRGLGEHETKDRDSVGHWIPPDIANPHITRGMKGCIEWPRAIIQKNDSKAKLLEAKIERQRSQLRHVLKQKLR